MESLMLRRVCVCGSVDAFKSFQSRKTSTSRPIDVGNVVGERRECLRPCSYQDGRSNQSASIRSRLCRRESVPRRLSTAVTLESGRFGPRLRGSVHKIVYFTG